MIRSLSFLFAVLLVWLSLKPGFDALLENSQTQAICCEIKCTNTCSDERPVDDGCTGANCNPFQACGQCVLVVPEAPLAVATLPEFYQTATAFQPNHFCFDVPSTHWQPPRHLTV